MGLFERFLTVWVLLCIVLGVFIGQWMPVVPQYLGAVEIAHVNLPVGLLIWIMIIPMLMKIDFSTMGDVRQQKAGIAITLLVNWAIKPFSMALFGWLFIGYVFRAWLPEAQIDSYIAGLVLLGAAPCTAMVFVWCNLCRGNANFTLSQIAMNDLIMVFAFAPIVALLLGVSSIPVPWETLLLSVLVYIVMPLMIAQVIRKRLLRSGLRALEQALLRIAPFSMLALLMMLVLLFAFQGASIVAQPLIIVLLAVPILVQAMFVAGLGYWLNLRFRVSHEIAGPSVMIGASNFFELSVAVAVVLFGLESGATLATVVGVLVEVPVMMILVKVVNQSQDWYTRQVTSASR